MRFASCLLGPNLNPAWPGNCEPPRPSPPIPETDDIKDSATETDADSGHGGDLVSQYPAKPRKGWLPRRGNYFLANFHYQQQV